MHVQSKGSQNPLRLGVGVGEDDFWKDNLPTSRANPQYFYSELNLPLKLIRHGLFHQNYVWKMIQVVDHAPNFKEYSITFINISFKRKKKISNVEPTFAGPPRSYLNLAGTSISLRQSQKSVQRSVWRKITDLYPWIFKKKTCPAWENSSFKHIIRNSTCLPGSLRFRERRSRCRAIGITITCRHQNIESWRYNIW